MSWKNSPTYKNRKEIGRQRKSGGGRIGLDNGRANASLRGDIQLRAKNMIGGSYSNSNLQKAYVKAKRNKDTAVAKIILQKINARDKKSPNYNEGRIKKIRDLKSIKGDIKTSRKKLNQRKRNNWYEGNQKRDLNNLNRAANSKRIDLFMNTKRYKKYSDARKDTY